MSSPLERTGAVINRRILVTGAAGFIGSHVIEPLLERGFEVHTLGRRRPAHPAIRHYTANLLDPAQVQAAVEAARASHLLHLAWSVEPGAFWRSPRNLDWVAASLGLARAFAEAGGTRLLSAGTCAEYQWGAPRLSEHETPCEPATLYGVSKDALRRTLLAFAQVAGLSIAWGRIFYLYGPNEPPGRLVSGAIQALCAGQRFETSNGRQRRDFMHVADVAGAFAALADSEVEGAVNVGSGKAMPVRSLLEAVARLTGGADRIDFGARALAATEPPIIEAAIARLRDEAGFAPRFTIEDGIAETVAAMDPDAVREAQRLITAHSP